MFACLRMRLLCFGDAAGREAKVVPISKGDAACGRGRFAGNLTIGRLAAPGQSQTCQSQAQPTRCDASKKQVQVKPIPPMGIASSIDTLRVGAPDGARGRRYARGTVFLTTPVSGPRWRPRSPWIGDGLAAVGRPLRQRQRRIRSSRSGYERAFSRNRCALGCVRHRPVSEVQLEQSRPPPLYRSDAKRPDNGPSDRRLRGRAKRCRPSLAHKHSLLGFQRTGFARSMARRAERHVG